MVAKASVSSKPEVVLVEGPAGSSEPVPAPAPIAWSFMYDGPIEPADDRLCEMCNAAAMKRCGKGPAQHTSYDSWLKRQPAGTPAPQDPCSTCKAARDAYCPNHCGVAKMLEEHDKHVTIDKLHEEAWATVRRQVLELKGTFLKATKIRVHATMAQDVLPDGSVSPGVRLNVHVATS